MPGLVPGIDVLERGQRVFERSGRRFAGRKRVKTSSWSFDSIRTEAPDVDLDGRVVLRQGPALGLCPAATRWNPSHEHRTRCGADRARPKTVRRRLALHLGLALDRDAAADGRPRGRL